MAFRSSGIISGLFPIHTFGGTSVKFSYSRQIFLGLILVASVSGCAVTLDAPTLGVPVSMSEPAGEEVTGAEFSVTKKAVFLLWGTVGAGNPSLENVLEGQLVDGTEIRNLRIVVRTKFTDILAGLLTGGLILTRSVTFEGTVVQGAEAGQGGN